MVSTMRRTLFQSSLTSRISFMIIEACGSEKYLELRRLQKNTVFTLE